MTDLTKIEKPFGLLDEATQKALRECGGPWEWLNETGRWETRKVCYWNVRNAIYRQKPQPPKPREGWVTRMWPTKEAAEHIGHGEAIFVREAEK